MINQMVTIQKFVKLYENIGNILKAKNYWAFSDFYL